MEYRPPVCVVPFTEISLERTLPTPGQVLVRVGDKVDATDVIARALQPGTLFALNAARALGVGYTALPRFVLKHEGEGVKRNDLLAARGGILGLFRKKVVSPVSGTLLAVTQGRILLEGEATTVELRAGVRGEIAKVMPNHGATIRTTGAMVYGAWGSGAESYGVIHLLVADRATPLTADLIDVSCHGATIVGGSSLDEAALQQAAEMRVRAIIVGSLPVALLDRVQQLAFPVMATEGLGAIPMAEPTFRLLRQHQGREAVIVQQKMAWGVSRPRLLIPLPAEEQPQDQAQSLPLAPGTHVRLLRAPYTGEVGEVASAPQMMEEPLTHLRFDGILVRLDRGRTAMVPTTNVEIVLGNE